MSETLNPDEVNALMSAIESGRVGPENGSPPPRGNVSPYDLTSQDRIIRGQMPTLDAINDQVASMLAMGVSGRVRLNVKVAATPATLLKFLDLATLLAPPATVAVLSLGSSHGQALAVMEPGLADALLAAALGDRKARPSTPSEGRREPTGVENLVLRRLLGLLTEAMGPAWAPVLPFRPQVIRLEHDPRMATIAPPTDVAIVTCFELAGALSGRLHLIIPYAAVEPAKSRLSSPPRPRTTGDERFAEALASEMEQVKVEVRGILGEAQVSLARLLELADGDVLLLSTDESAPVPVLVQGRVKLKGTPTIQGGAHAVVVEQDLRGTRPGKRSAHRN